MRHITFILLSTVLLCGFTCSRLPEPDKKPIVSEETLEIVTKAFTAEAEGTNWKLTLNPEHFGSDTKAVAIHYNDIYYGVFLTSDTVFIPLLIAPEVELLISPVDDNGRAVSTETFYLRRETNDTEATTSP